MKDETPQVKDAKPILKLKRPRAQGAQPRAEQRGQRPSPRPPSGQQGKPRAGKAQGPTPATIRPAPGQEDRLLDALRKLAPETWDPDLPQPLAVGIHAQIFPVAEPLGISRSAVRRFLTRWTSRPEYLDAMSQPGALRHGVDGAEGEPVEERHARRARRRLEAPADSADEVTPADESHQDREPPPTRESAPSRR